MYVFYMWILCMWYVFYMYEYFCMCLCFIYICFVGLVVFIFFFCVRDSEYRYMVESGIGGVCSIIREGFWSKE